MAAMALESVFDKLVGELSTTERQELLTKIRFSERVSDSPLYDAASTDENDFDSVLRKLTFVERVSLFLRRILTGKEYTSLIEEIVVKRIGRSLRVRAPGLLSTRDLSLRDDFRAAVENLADATKFYRQPLKSALGPFRKDFYAFLAGMELPLFQDELLKETNPEVQEQPGERVSAFDMKRSTEALVQDSFDAISETDRTSMYQNAQCLHALHDLASFPFEKITNRFVDSEGGKGCPGQVVLPALKDLAAVLRALAVPPKIGVLEALFIFEMRERLHDPELQMDVEIDRSLLRAEDALAAIRSFNAEVPLVDIIRFIAKDCNWAPSYRTGGEDWFVLFKQFWNERLDRLFSDYAIDKKQRETVEKATSLLRLARLPILEHYRSDLFSETGGVAHDNSIAFALGWTNIVFEQEISRSTKVLLLDGRFYKDDNRKELTDAFNRISRLPSDIRQFDRSLEEDGKHGRLLSSLRDSPTAAERSRMSAMIMDEVDAEARRIVASMIESLTKMERVVAGVLYGHGDDAYDTISNLNQIGGRENGKLLALLRTSHEKIGAAHALLAELYDVEMGKSR